MKDAPITKEPTRKILTLNKHADNKSIEKNNKFTQVRFIEARSTENKPTKNKSPENKSPENKPTDSLNQKPKNNDNNNKTYTHKGRELQNNLPSNLPDNLSDNLPKTLENTVPCVYTPSFESIYNQLHSIYPAIINLKNPVLLAINIKQEIAKACGISVIAARKWIGQYFYKSRYYKIHKKGAMRYDLEGNEAGVVTAKQQESLDKLKEKNKEKNENKKIKDPNI